MFLQCLARRRWLAAALAAIYLPTASVGQPDSPEAALQQALEVLRSGRGTEARVLLEELVARWPRHLRANYQLGRLAFARGDLEAARGYLETATGGEFPRVFSAWYYLGRVRILKREFGAAVAAFDRATERAPAFAPAYAERGRARLFLGEIESGLRDLLRASEEPGGPAYASLLLSQLLVVLGRTDEARANLDRSAAGLADADQRWSHEARWLRMVIDRPPDVERQLVKELEEHCQTAAPYWALGAVLEDVDPVRARRLFEISLQIDSENPVTLISVARSDVAPDTKPPPAIPMLQATLTRARRLEEEGRFEEATELAYSLVRERDLLAPGWMLIASGAEVRGDLWLALGIYEQLLEWLGDVPGLALSLARVAYSMGAADLAVCGLEAAHRQGGADGSSWYLLAAIEESRDQVDSAIEACQRAIDTGYEDVRVWLKLGGLYFQQMRISDSIAAYEKAIQLDPLAAEEVRPFALSTLTTEQYESLRGLLERHVEARPESASTLYSLGIMSLRDGRLDEARRYLERLADIEPGHRQVHYNLGQIYLRQGDTVAGRAQMEQFQRLRAAEDNEWERHNHAHFRRLEARAAVDNGNPEEAIALYSRSIKDGTAETIDMFELGAAYLAAGRPMEALAVYDRVLALSPYDRLALEGVRAAAEVLADGDRIEEVERQLTLLDWPCKMASADGRDEP